MEKFGYQKRDLLIERVQEGKDEQAAAQKQFQSTFDAFKQRFLAWRLEQPEPARAPLHLKCAASRNRAHPDAQARADDVASVD